jgi:hypothetical protein
MKAKPFLTLILMALTAMPVGATTVKWLAQPEYDAISYYSNDIFKCKKDGKYQLIDLDGKSLLPFMADSITDFCEGYALVLDFLDEKDHAKKTNNFISMEIKGYLSEKDHRFIRVDGNFRTIFYSYFSEGLLAVADSKGKLGYLDTNGNLFIRCHYKSARPFIKGWASVMPDSKKKEVTYYIDKYENPLRVQFHDGVLHQASSFNENGEALVSYENDFAVINTKGNFVKNFYVGDNNTNPIRRHDFAFDESGIDVAPSINEKPNFTSEIFAIKANKLFGYKMRSDTILKPQLSYAGKFADDCAIAARDGKFGILTLVDGSFSSNIDNTTISFTESETAKANYSLTIPQGLDDSRLTVKFDNGNGKLKTLGMGEYHYYTFTPQVTGADKSCIIRAEVSMDGLILWEDKITLGVQTVKPVEVSSLEVTYPRRTSERADSNDRLSVRSMITNADEPVDATVSFTTSPLIGKNRIVSKTEFDASLDSGQKKTFSITFEVKEKEDVWVTVTIKDGEQELTHKKAKVTLIPFDYFE